jgi:hypothetical protein
MTLYDCPECALPATATPRGPGLIKHVYVRCVAGHWFLGPLEMLTRRPVVEEIANGPGERRAA